ncbi:MAG: Elongation factor 4 [Parcubacteria group bacterium GW2011_GWB1_52_7]|nr:MAG: Elongation factor 4 [Parcubacteria group bacterium GW2011_GWB1_52_7]KKW30563.1 MAG: Elongation factor 4 [Parcubacteria group bacterium GW2011_GWC2_52_8c]
MDADEFPALKDALDKLKLNDAALSYEVEASEALGRGFRVGFLGMLHLEIVSERIKREFGIQMIVSTPSVSYVVKFRSGEEVTVYAAANIPDEAEILEIAEPWVRLEIIAPADFLGRILKLLETTRGRYVDTRYLSAMRMLVIYRMPLKEIIVDFYDRLKSATSGYASMGYEFEGYNAGDLERLDILIAGRRERAFSAVVHKNELYEEGQRITTKLKELLPSQAFAVPIQAAVGGRIIARETLSAMRKDVTGYLYGGDRTRKMKLWKKQKKGKKRLAEQGMGKVEIPPDVFLKMLKR